MTKRNRADNPPNAFGVYTTKRELDRLLATGRAEQGCTCSWHFKSWPTWVAPESDFWLAFDGHWQGFFHVEGVDYDGREITFHSNSWHQLVEPVVLRKPFSGNRYDVPSGNLFVKCGQTYEFVGIGDSFGCHRVATPALGTVSSPKGASDDPTERMNWLEIKIDQSMSMTSQLMATVQRIRFYSELQLIFPMLLNMDEKNMRRTLMEFFGKLYDREEIKKNQKEFDMLVQSIIESRKYRSSPDSKKDVT